ncbi:MAG: hypothetical protein COB67_09180 [SAR324 cluster bacterium]|uniref:Uncharacterized protein n=1 Tax=SAR324 cluster bacterium TaxID=2024889 RepID=A0A2A4T0Q0_9DELT|nr:MAG: hypothetical protein COB67_09180 [SAR324 cluster bacterium]
MKIKTSCFALTQALFWIACFAGSGYAQVVTPSLDPTAPIVLPAAAGWKQMSTIGVSSFERTGSRDFNGSSVYEFQGTGYSGHFNFMMGEKLAVDAYAYGDSMTISKDTYLNGRVNLETNEARLSLTLSHEEFTIFGLGVQTITTKDHILELGLDSDETTTLNKTIPSLSLKIGDYFYLGGGMERIKESSSFMVGNSWANLVAGVALQMGSPESSMFRFEYSQSNSPKSVSSAKGGKKESVHLAETISRINAELKVKGLVLSISIKDRKRKVNLIHPVTGDKVEVDQTINSQLGVLLVPQEGAILGFIFHTDTRKELFEDKVEGFEIKLSYAF